MKFLLAFVVAIAAMMVMVDSAEATYPNGGFQGGFVYGAPQAFAAPACGPQFAPQFAAPIYQPRFAAPVFVPRGPVYGGFGRPGFRGGFRWWR